MTNNDWDAALRGFLRSLKARNLSDNTILIYRKSARLLLLHLQDHCAVSDPNALRRGHVECHLSAYAATRKPNTVSISYRALKQFTGWLTDEEWIEQDPMAKMKPPVVPETLMPVIPDADLTALLATCSGKTYIERRDTAIIRVLLDSGGRLSEVALLRIDDLALDVDRIEVTGKGRRQRQIVLAPKTLDALEKYLRFRRRERKAALPQLWLSEKGRGGLSANGVHQMLKRRGAAAGLPDIHAHLFRHTAAHTWLAAGGQESDLMHNMGWKSPAMVRRYGNSLAKDRAREASRKLALGDRV